MKKLTSVLGVLLLALTVGVALAQTQVGDDASPAPKSHAKIDQTEEHVQLAAQANLEFTEATVGIEQLIGPPRTEAEVVALASSDPSAYAACVRNWTRGIRTCWYNFQNCSGTFCVAKFDRCTDEVHHALERCLEAID